MTPDRRAILASLAAASATAAKAQTPPAKPAPAPLSQGPGPGEAEILLWERGAPGAPARPPEPVNINDIRTPKVFISRPERPNGCAIVMFQGGGYQRIGRSLGVPRWFKDRGFTVFDVLYRLPGGGWAAGPDVGLQDGQRAVRLVRSRAAEFGVDPARIGVAGFSSGGHMASTIATRFGAEMAPKGSGLTDISPRPDFALMACPVITMLDPFAHGGSRKEMFGTSRDPAALELRSNEKQVTAATPPTNLIHCADDPVVPVNNSLMMFAALKAAKVPVEMHIFEVGGHGMGQGFLPDTPVSAYPGLWLDWLARHKFAPKASV